MEEFDIIKQIQESTDVDYLNDLLKAIDIDIDNVRNSNKAFTKLKATARSMDVETYINKCITELNELKTKIQERLNMLCLK